MHAHNDMSRYEDDDGDIELHSHVTSLHSNLFSTNLYLHVHTSFMSVRL